MVINNDIKQLAKFSKKIKTEYINKKDLETFVNSVKNLGEKVVVVDVRNNTFYKTDQGFSPRDLAKTLAAKNIEYLRYKHLGNPFHWHYKDEPEKAKLTYTEYLRVNDDAHAALNDLYKHLRFKKTFCLICYCNTLDPMKCHRFWLREALINKKRERLGFSPTFRVAQWNENPREEELEAEN